MKNKNCFWLALFCLLTISFKNADLAPGRTYNLFYVDNSYSKTYENLNQDIFDIIEKKVDSLKNDKLALIGFFVSDGEKEGSAKFASNYNGAKYYIGTLSNASTNAPNSFYDRSAIIDNLLTTDHSNIKAVNLNLFLTEAGLLNDYFLGANTGILINTLPKEIQFLLSCNEDNIKVTIYYPASSKKIKLQNLQSFTDFPNKHTEFGSKISFRFQPI